jgi:hypothetical protein
MYAYWNQKVIPIYKFSNRWCVIRAGVVVHANSPENIQLQTMQLKG